MSCTGCDREEVSKLPKNAFPVACAGCGDIIYGLEDEGCRQVRLKEARE